MIDKHGYKGEYLFYCILIGNINECYERVSHWRNVGNKYIVHCQPYRDLHKVNQHIPQWQKDMAQWADRKETFFSADFKEFEPRKGFKCDEYFKSNQ